MLTAMINWTNFVALTAADVLNIYRWKLHFSGSFDLSSHDGPLWKTNISYKLEAEIIGAENTRVSKTSQILHNSFKINTEVKNKNLCILP